MTKNEHGTPWISTVTLHPHVIWSGEKTPTPGDVERLHHQAHEQCFIANSVKTAITVESANPLKPATAVLTDLTIRS